MASKCAELDMARADAAAETASLHQQATAEFEEVFLSVSTSRMFQHS